MTSIRRDILIGLVCLAFAVALPVVMPGRYIITQSTLFFIWAIVVVQWNLVLGIGGIFSLAQMALAWVLAQGDFIVPIPGVRKIRHLEDNVQAVNVVLTAEDKARLDAASAPDKIAGKRYNDNQLALTGL